MVFGIWNFFSVVRRAGVIKMAFAIVKFLNEKTADEKFFVDLVPVGWITVAPHGLLCSFPPPPYSNVPKISQTKKYPDFDWKQYEVEVMGHANTYAEGVPLVERAARKLTISSSEDDQSRAKTTVSAVINASALLLKGPQFPALQSKSDSVGSQNIARAGSSDENAALSNSTALLSMGQLADSRSLSNDGRPASALSDSLVTKKPLGNNTTENILPCGPDRKYFRSKPVTKAAQKAECSATAIYLSCSDPDQSDDNDSSSQDESTLNGKRTPLTKKKKKKSKTEHDYSSGSEWLASDKSENETLSMKRKKKSSEKMSKKLQKKSVSDGIFSSTILDEMSPTSAPEPVSAAALQKVIDIIEKEMKRSKRSVNHELRKLQRKVDELRGALQLHVKAHGGTLMLSAIADIEGEEKFPCSTLESFERFNETLNDKETFKKCVSVISALHIPIGKRQTLTKSISAILERYIAPEVSLQFSGQGKGRLKKLNFSATKFYRALEAGLLSAEPGLSTKDVIMATSTVLAKTVSEDKKKKTGNEENDETETKSSGGDYSE